MLMLVTVFRESNMEIHLKYGIKFLKIAFASDHINYARYNSAQDKFCLYNSAQDMFCIKNKESVKLITIFD